MPRHTQWEYLTVEASWDDMLRSLDDWGKTGWEAVGMYPVLDPTRVLLKRPVLGPEDT